VGTVSRTARVSVAIGNLEDVAAVEAFILGKRLGGGTGGKFEGSYY
jgi:hypothetical protein